MMNRGSQANLGERLCEYGVYSSAALPRDKREGWRRIVNDVYCCPLEIEIKENFSGEIRCTSISRLDLTEFITDPETACRRRAHLVNDDDAYFLFQLVRWGDATFQQYGRECVLRPDQYTLLYTGEPYSFAHERPVRGLCIKIPSAALRSRTTDLHSLCCLARPIGRGLSKVAADLLLSVADEGHKLPENAATVIEAQILDLIGLVLDSQREQKPAGGTAARWAIHRRAESHMKEHLGAPELTPERIAAAIGVSARYLHHVFKDSGRTVTETLMKLRLEKCHKDLADPQLAPFSIKAIVFRNGFKNQSHFACAFKSEYGYTPTQVRESAWASPPSTRID